MVLGAAEVVEMTNKGGADVTHIHMYILVTPTPECSQFCVSGE